MQYIPLEKANVDARTGIVSIGHSDSEFIREVEEKEEKTEWEHSGATTDDR